MEQEAEIFFFDLAGGYRGIPALEGTRKIVLAYEEKAGSCLPAGFLEILEAGSISPYGLHFFDEASFHFLTKFFLEELKEDFVLLLFDHQADLKKGEGDGLSHRSWLREVMLRVPHCKGILLLGTPEKEKAGINDALMSLSEEYEEVPDAGKSYRDPILNTSLYCFTDMDFQTGRAQAHIPRLLKLLNLPLYCSMDKEILGERFTEKEFDEGISFILKSGMQILGMDIFEEEKAKDEEKNWLFNEKLITNYYKNHHSLFLKRKD